MAAYGKLHQKMPNITKGYCRIGRRQTPKIAPKNLKLSAITCRNGRILTINCQTTPSEALSSIDRDIKAVMWHGYLDRVIGDLEELLAKPKPSLLRIA